MRHYGRNLWAAIAGASGEGMMHPVVPKNKAADLAYNGRD